MSDDFLLERLATARPRPATLPGAGVGPRPAYREESPFKIHGGCGLMGICDESGALMPAEVAVRAMAIQRDRGNGLGAGFAGYGIYPEFPDHFCFHLMLHDERAREEVEAVLEGSFVVDQAEPIPTRHFGAAVDAPLLWRYFLLPDPRALETLEIGPEDLVVHTVMQINAHVDGAFVASSGTNMGAFKGVAYPEEIAHFYRLEEYEAHTWIGHNRFPTNTPGWWGGAHPFTCSTGRSCTTARSRATASTAATWSSSATSARCGTDTEVIAYLFDLMLRRHGLPLELACEALASPLWSEIDRTAPGGARAEALAARRLRPGDAQRAVRHRARLQRRHGRAERPHQAAAAGRGRQGLASSWSPPRRAPSSEVLDAARPGVGAARRRTGDRRIQSAARVVG